MTNTGQKLYNTRQATRQLKVIRRGTWYSIYVPNGDDAYVSKLEDGATERVRGEEALRGRLAKYGCELKPFYGYYNPTTQGRAA